MKTFIALSIAVSVTLCFPTASRVLASHLSTILASCPAATQECPE